MNLNPPPGSIDDLRLKAEEAHRLYLREKDREYLTSDRFRRDLDLLFRATNGGNLPNKESLEEKIKEATDQVKKTYNEYMNYLWGK